MVVGDSSMVLGGTAGAQRVGRLGTGSRGTIGGGNQEQEEDEE